MRRGAVCIRAVLRGAQTPRSCQPFVDVSVGCRPGAAPSPAPGVTGSMRAPPFCTHILRHRRCSVVPGPRGDRCCHPALLQDVPSSSAPTAGSLALVRVLDP